MRKKMYWGIASLILIIGVVGVYFMLQPESDTEPEKRYIVPTEAELNKAREARKPPPGASPNGHWHGNEWHEESHAEPANVPPAAVAIENVQKVKVSNPFEGEDHKPSEDSSWEDTYRKYSREKLESRLKSHQWSIEQLKTKNIPHLEKLREKKLKFLESIPDSISEHTKKGLADVEAEIRQYEFEIKNMEGMIATISKVLNEKALNEEATNNVEK